MHISLLAYGTEEISLSRMAPHVHLQQRLRPETLSADLTLYPLRVQFRCVLGQRTPCWKHRLTRLAVKRERYTMDIFQVRHLSVMLREPFQTVRTL